MLWKMVSKLSINFINEIWRLKRFRSPGSVCGSPVKTVYSSKYDEKGNIVLVEVGEENIYDQIQSFAESVDINTIMRRFELGDSSALNSVQGFFGDFSAIPDNWAEILNVVNEGKANFDKMPNSFKEKYGNDFARFVCTCDFSDFVPRPDVPSTEKAEVVKETADES